MRAGDRQTVACAAGEPGEVTWLCLRDNTEFDGRAEMIEGNFDPAAIGESDRCPTCGHLDAVVSDWRPDTPEGYRIWAEAPGIAT